MIIEADGNFLAHATKSRSKYAGGFKNGKNTSAYNHDYYLKNKAKWIKKGDVQGSFDEDYDKIQQMPDGPEKKQAYKQYENRKAMAGKGQNSVTPSGKKEESKKAHGRKRNDSGKTTDVKKREMTKESPQNDIRKTEGRKRNDSGKTTEVKKRKPGRKPIGKVIFKKSRGKRGGQ